MTPPCGVPQCRSRHLQKFQIDRYEESSPATGYTTWDSNWKLAFENGIESYHLFNVHTKTLEPGSPTRDAFYVEGGASWTITAGTLHPGRKAKPWDPPTIGAFENENYTLVSIPPSLVGILTPDSWGWLSVLPLAPDRCLIVSMGKDGRAKALASLLASGLTDAQRRVRPYPEALADTMWRRKPMVRNQLHKKQGADQPLASVAAAPIADGSGNVRGVVYVDSLAGSHQSFIVEDLELLANIATELRPLFI